MCSWVPEQSQKLRRSPSVNKSGLGVVGGTAARALTPVSRACLHSPVSDNLLLLSSSARNDTSLQTYGSTQMQKAFASAPPQGII